MSEVITKLRCYSPNLPDTTSGNVKHLFYIADRKNALRDKNNSSIFGDYESEIRSLNKKNLAKHIKEMSKTGNNIYRGIISLREIDALRLGYNTNRNAWENMLNRSIREIAKVVDIQFSRLEYCGVVHYKKGNPHLHYMFWERGQTIKTSFITEGQQNNIRDIVTKNIYKEELKELYHEKAEIHAKSISNRDILEDIKAIDLDTCTGKIPFIKMRDKQRKEIIKQIKQLSTKVPKRREISIWFYESKYKRRIK